MVEISKGSQRPIEIGCLTSLGGLLDPIAHGQQIGFAEGFADQGHTQGFACFDKADRDSHCRIASGGVGLGAGDQHINARIGKDLIEVIAGGGLVGVAQGGVGGRGAVAALGGFQRRCG
jgi:hypothetical protein